MQKISRLALATLVAALTAAACGSPPTTSGGDDVTYVDGGSPPTLTKEQCQTMFSSVHLVNWSKCGPVSPPMTFTGETFSCTSEVGLLPDQNTKCGVKCAGVFGWRDLTDPASISIQADGLHFTMENPPKPWGCRR